MGTRFHAAEQSLLARPAKMRIVHGSGDDTLRTKIFDIAVGGDWPQEYTGRVLPNGFSEKWRGREAALATDAAEFARYAKAREADDFDTAVISEKWRGREAALATDAAEFARYAKAREADDFDTAVIHAGEAIDLVRAIEPAGEIVALVVAEAKAALAQRFL